MSELIYKSSGIGGKLELFDSYLNYNQLNLSNTSIPYNKIVSVTEVTGLPIVSIRTSAFKGISIFTKNKSKIAQLIKERIN